MAELFIVIVSMFVGAGLALGGVLIGYWIRR